MRPLQSVGFDYFGRVTCFAPDQREPVIVTPSPNMWNIGRIACRRNNNHVSFIIANQGGVLEVGKGAVVIFAVAHVAERLGDQVPVADHHPLGGARRAGGEGEDGRVGGRVEGWGGEGGGGGEEGVEGEVAAQGFVICRSVVWLKNFYLYDFERYLDGSVRKRLSFLLCQNSGMNF